MKYLGIDFGTKKIGVAVSDDTGTLAFPLATVKAGSTAVEETIELAQKNNVEKIVLGESRDFRGEANPLMKEIEQFRKELEVKGLNVVYEPELFSSAAAARQFAPDGSRKQTPSQEKLDASAAAVILQSFLDRMKHNGGN